jgi:nucleoside-diphosphate kinase
VRLRRELLGQERRLKSHPGTAAVLLQFPDFSGAYKGTEMALFPQLFPGVLQVAVERTLSIIKPDAVGKNHIGDIYNRFEKAGLKIIAARMKHMTPGEAEGFYAVHKERPFFKDLVKFMTSGPVMVSVLEGPNAVAKHREIMGATDPKKAEKGTIRADFAKSIDENAVHGSDSLDNARTEISYFFRTTELCPRTR